MIIIRPILELVRLEEADVGTFGVLKVNKQIRFYTLEPPDFENEAYISSIPCQQYVIERHTSPRHGLTFRVKTVPHRSDILFHTGNWLDETQGCILLGLNLIPFPKRGVGSSRVAHEMFMEDMEGYDTGHLTVQEVF
jgi:hypothetical protein